MKKITIQIVVMIFATFTSRAQAPAFDDFERTGGLGANWTAYFGSPDIVADSDLGIWAGSFCIAAWTGSIFNADQYSEAIISTEKIDSMWAQVFVRRRTSDFARYAFHWSDRDGDTVGVWDIKYDGVATNQTRYLATVASIPPTPGDTIRIEVIDINGDPVIKGYHNGLLLLTATDTALTKIMNGEPGMAFRFRIGFPQTYPQKVFEEWSGGSLLTTGVEKIGNTANFFIYPNPFSTQTTLQPGNLLNNATLTVDNCFGQTVAQIKNISGQTITFNRDNIPSGLYFLRLTEGNKTIAIDKLVIADK